MISVEIVTKFLALCLSVNHHASSHAMLFLIK